MATVSLKSLSCLCVLLGLLAGSASAAEDIWAKYASENFVIYTASSAGKAEKVLQHLERVRRAYAYMLNAELSGEQPVNVLLFKNQKEYLDYAPTKTSVGYYTQALGQDFIVIADFNENVETVLNHEYFHLYARHQKFNWPTWANEGFADYFSTLRLSKKTLEVGHPIDNHMRYLLNTSRKLNAESLFAMGSEERHVAGQRVVSDLYAMSWALVHFLFSDAQRLPAMLEALQLNDDSAVAFQQVYGWGVKDVDNALKDYLGRSTMGFRRQELEEGQLTFDAAVSPTELAEWEAPLLLADVMTNVRKYDEAEQEYLRLAALYPDAPDIDDSRAQLLMRKGDREGALPLLQSAIAKGSTNPNTYRLYVFNECRDGSPSPECLEMAGKAVELAPNDKQIKFFNISLFNRSGQFVQALLLANKVGKITQEEAPSFFYQAGYAQYRLGQLDDARKSVEMGLRLAKSPSERMPLDQLAEALDRRETELAARMPAPEAASLTAGSPTTVEPTDDTLTPGEFQTADDARDEFVGSRTSGVAVESLAQRLINSFNGDGAAVVEGQLSNMNCSTIPPALTVITEEGALKVLIDDPALVSIIRDGRIADDYQFTCGPQSGETIRVGYAGSSDGGPGVFLRLLQFGAI